MIPLLIFGFVTIVVYLAAHDTPKAETIDNTVTGYTAPAAANAVPYGSRNRYSELTSPTLVSGPHGTGPGQVGRTSVYTSSSRDSSLRTSQAPSGNYVPPPASNPAISRREVGSTTVVASEPRIYTAPASVSYKPASSVSSRRTQSGVMVRESV